MKFAITGASGQLGRRAADIVLATTPSENLILATRSPSRLTSLAARGVEVRCADFAEPQSLRAAFAGVDRLLLVSATDLAERSEQHRAAIAAAEAAGVQHVVYTSGLQPEPPNPALVAPSHHATEQALLESELGFTILRNSLYADYQLAEGMSARESGVLVHNRGNGAVAYVAREDCAAAAAAALLDSRHDGAVYDITGSERFTAADLARLYAQMGGRLVRARALDDEHFIAALMDGATGDDHLRYGAELVASFGRAIREGYMDNCTDAVATLTGRAPLALRHLLSPLARARG